MKKLLLAAFVAVLTTMAGCAGDQALARAQADAQTRASEARVAEAQASAEESKAVQRLADKIDAGGATAYLLAKALKGLNVGQAAAPQVAPVAVAPHWAVQVLTGALTFAKDAALGLAPVVGQVLVARTNAHTQEIVAGYNRDTTLGAYTAFSTMGGQIATAGIAGYPYIQAPGAVTTTTTTNTNTVSGSGVIGSGVYNGPRTCAGGTGASGGNGSTPGSTGGPGGAANGGAC